MMFFLAIKHIVTKMHIHGSVKRGSLLLGECTLGIYLCHIEVKEMLVNMINVMRQYGINDMLSVLVYCCTVMLLGCGITLVCKKIPIIKKMI